MKSLLSYGVVTGAYWSFMLTDGALRMIILLYFHRLGYTAVTLASLFLFYEFFGILTNLFGGWLATRYGLKSTLIWGLTLQPIALLALSFLNEGWDTSVAIPFVMAVQSLSGISKDLTKMASKTAVKYLVPKEKSSSLFRWVAFLTGSKNAIKGFGFFVGAFLLQSFGFSGALWALASVVVLALIFSLSTLPDEIGVAKVKSRLRGLLNQKREVRILSLARVFLFGARDIWFVVAVPVYLSTSLGWSYTGVGTFMAVWVIAYGVVQALTPALLKWLLHDRAPSGGEAVLISVLLFISMLTITALFEAGYSNAIVVGLIIFGAIFALNSSVHSFLVLEYADGDKAAANVGFYYMANAGGRLLGTLLSGLLFQRAGVSGALIGSTLFLALTTIITTKLPRRGAIGDALQS